MKVGRNAACPCGSGGKFKSCCHGKVDWEAILNRGTANDVVTRMTARGKNLLFGRKISEILQLNKLPHDSSWLDIKRAMTPEAVRAIHEAVDVIWPNEHDLTRVLELERENYNALYVGTYQPEPVARGLARHALYSDTILLIDPFLHPKRLADKFNPLLHPEEHRANTLVALRLWMMIGPWIDAGIARVIRTPGDFDNELFHATLNTAHDRMQQSAELRDLLEKSSVDDFDPDDEYKQFLFLCNSDAKIENVAREQNPDITVDELREALRAVRDARENHPFFVDVVDENRPGGDFLSFSSGTNYDMAKLIAAETNAHLVTDLGYRWKEIEYDRSTSGIDPHRWSGFAKALQQVNLRYINLADLNAAKRLREEERLEGLRALFRKIWRTVSKDDSFSESLATDLASELVEKVGEAEAEWAKIDQDLLKWFGSETAAIGAIVASGHGDLLAAGVGTVGLGIANLAHAAMKRRSFPRRYPAAFFIGA
jgi:hypothetical protein